jgi:hypothetical protein
MTRCAAPLDEKSCSQQGPLLERRPCCPDCHDVQLIRQGVGDRLDHAVWMPWIRGVATAGFVVRYLAVPRSKCIEVIGGNHRASRWFRIVTNAQGWVMRSRSKLHSASNSSPSPQNRATTAVRVANRSGHAGSNASAIIGLDARL